MQYVFRTAKLNAPIMLSASSVAEPEEGKERLVSKGEGGRVIDPSSGSTSLRMLAWDYR